MKGMTILEKLNALRPSKLTDADWDLGLPAEVLEKIFGYLVLERDNCPTSIRFTREVFQPTLRAAQLVCRAWNSFLEKYLYEDIYLSSTDALEILFTTLTNREGLRPLVHHFDFSGKVYKVGLASSPFTLLDDFHYNHVHELCPNLLHFHGANPIKKLPYGDPEKFCRVRKFDIADLSRVTSMDLSIPNRVMFGEHMVFPPWVEFPALQSLYVACSWRFEHHPMDRSTPRWFRMPKLRRLIIRNFTVRHWQVLTFPDSPCLRTIELSLGNYENVENLFNPARSPLLPFRKSLQTLTITAQALGCHTDDPGGSILLRALQLYGVRRNLWDMSFLENVEQLCVPIRSFARTTILSYPPRLREFAVSGFHWDGFKETERVQVDAHVKIKCMLEAILLGSGARNLTCVRVIIRHPDFFDDDFIEEWFDLNIEVKVQCEVIRFRNLGAEFIEIGRKKLRNK